MLVHRARGGAAGAWASLAFAADLIVAAQGTALQVALEMGQQLAEGPRESQAAILELLNGPDREAFERQLEREKQLMAIALGGAEAAEGIAAFKEKRAAQF